MGTSASKKRKRKHALKLILSYCEKNGDKDDWLHEFEDIRERSSTWNTFYINKLNTCYLKRLNMRKTSIKELRAIQS